jgi:hypothetical protein
MPVLVKRSSGSSTRLPTMVVWLSAAMVLLLARAGLAFVACPLGPSPDGGGAGGVDGVGGPVVLAGLPDDRVAVVLAAVVDGHPDPEGEGGFAVSDGLAAIVVVLVGGDAELGVEPVEGLLGVADDVALDGRMGVAEHMG